QFRMPGYPLVLVSTDVLQEGEDLHTFCSDVFHYGVAWTPSSMEQRIGRIDRVRSQTDRRLARLSSLADSRSPEPDSDASDRDAGAGAAIADQDKLQVYIPHLEDTVEVLQVRRVLSRMNTFLRLMHEGLTVDKREERRIDVKREIALFDRVVPQITEVLRTAFPINDALLNGRSRDLTIESTDVDEIQQRFAALPDVLKRLRKSTEGWVVERDGAVAPDEESIVPLEWEPMGSSPRRGFLLASARLPFRLRGGRVQPFSLLLGSHHRVPSVRCISPIGVVEFSQQVEQIRAWSERSHVRIGAIATKDHRSYNLTVEGDVLLGDPSHDAQRVASLIGRIVTSADRLEADLLPDRDRPLEEFRDNLDREGLYDE
ncbi:MAG: hypothetical protein KC729_20255, partial [Candidatus Eisenbacteria bacterium]|nr:hypothetical protein [Candidatus Eisenbacteria bacterium]